MPDRCALIHASARVLVLMFAQAVSIDTARAQVLVSQQYGVEAGLANNTVGTVFQDSKGYIWFATAEGLSRYDGRGFVNYDTADGLPHAVVRDIAEDRWGHLWITTFGGLARLVEGAPTERPVDRFLHLPLAHNASPGQLVAAPDGALWCMTDRHGLLRGYPTERGEIVFSIVVSPERLSPTISILHVDGLGRTWVGLPDSLAIVGANPERRVPFPFLRPPDRLAMTSDEAGRILLAAHGELYELSDVERPAWRRLPIALPAGTTIISIAVDRRGLVWIGTSQGIFGWRRDAYADHPLRGPAGWMSWVRLDRQQNLWATTYGHGVFKVSRDLIVTYPTEPALGVDRVVRLVDDAAGHVYGLAQSGALFDVEANAVRVLARRAPPLDTVYRRILRDRRGRWWALTDGGLFSLDAARLGATDWRRVGTVRPERVENPVGPALTEDEEGHLWVGGALNALHRVDLDAPRLEPRPVPTTPRFEGIAAWLAVDRAKGVWTADRGHLRRLRGGALEIFGPRPGLPETGVRSMFIDARGWLWIGLRYGGVSVTKNPEADQPTFINYSTASGLRNNTIHAMTGDAYGRIYLVTGRGLDRLDPTDGRVRHYDVLGGAGASSIQWLMTGRDGRIWAATDGGAVRLDPDADRTALPAPPVYFTRVEAGGEAVPIAARSVTTVSDVTVPARRQSLRVEFASLSFDVGIERYQYRLEGVDTDWSAPTTTRVVDYPRLPAGGYRFLVRSLNDRDETSSAAIATFRVLQPFWRTPWFTALVLAAASAAGVGVYRLRVARILATERMRRQVALDLHDEVGSGLAEIAVLSEMAGDDAPAGAAIWPRVSERARTLRGAMSDIVWAVDPQKDRLADLAQRMKDVAFNLLEADRVSVDFALPTDQDLRRIEVGPQVRRQLLLIYKEALTNIATHAQATHVSIALVVDRHDVALTIRDNGRGFDPAAQTEGHGVRNFQRRAEALHGAVVVRSQPGMGTTIEARVPIRE